MQAILRKKNLYRKCRLAAALKHFIPLSPKQLERIIDFGLKQNSVIKPLKKPKFFYCLTEIQMQLCVLYFICHIWQLHLQGKGRKPFKKSWKQKKKQTHKNLHKFITKF